MPHYTTYGGTYFSGPDRLGQFGEETDVLTGNLDTNSGPGGTTFRTDNIGGTAGPGGSTYRSGQDDSIAVIHPSYRPVDDDKVIIHPDFQPEADGVIQRGDIYQDKAQLMQHAPKESEYRPEAQVNPVGVGYTEVEWTYFADNLGGTAGPGGSTFLTGYDETVGLDSSTVDVMNNILGSAGPGCDDI